MTGLIIYLCIGAIYAMVCLLLGEEAYTQKNQRLAGRMFFLAPVWPLAVVFLIGVVILNGVRDAWYLAGFGRKDIE